MDIWKQPCIFTPSLITLDLCNLERDVRIVEKSGIPMLHVDLLDGHFSPSMPLGLDAVRQLRALTDLPFDCHVMATNNDFFVGELLDIGVEQIVFHVETEPHIDGMLNRIRRAGVRAGLALRPATDLGVLDYPLEKCDTVLLMLINPGYASFGSETQVPYAERKIADLHRLIESRGLECLIELDGRISTGNIREWTGMADLFVLGSTCIRRSALEESLKDLQILRSRILENK
ncbi:MAG: ribulose-phosphate 3-epimerase [Clostridia bacterium]|nr:ribulose-phosphate 3-epimerase [Clostridia bacterium]